MKRNLRKLPLTRVYNGLSTTIFCVTSVTSVTRRLLDNTTRCYQECVDCLWEPCLVIAYSYYKCTCFYPLYIVCISVCLAASLANKGVHNHTAVSRVVWHNCDSHFTGCKRRISYNRDDEQCVNLRQNYKTPKMNFLTISDSKNCTFASSFIY